MKTSNKVRKILRLSTLCLIILTGTISVQAQHRDRDDRGRGRKHVEYRVDPHGRGNRQGEYRVEPHGRYRDFQGHRYYTRAPWGMRRPIILYHDHHRIYYYGGHYYQYYPNRGYLIIEIPSGYVFDEVPRGFSRVWINGAWCYRRDNFYLRPGIHGFITFPGPAGIRIGAGF